MVLTLGTGVRFFFPETQTFLVLLLARYIGIDDITSLPATHQHNACVLHVNKLPRHVSGKVLPPIKIRRRILSEPPHSAGVPVMSTRRSYPLPNQQKFFQPPVLYINLLRSALRWKQSKWLGGMSSGVTLSTVFSGFWGAGDLSSLSSSAILMKKTSFLDASKACFSTNTDAKEYSYSSLLKTTKLIDGDYLFHKGKYSTAKVTR
ncbi:hypothetical protein TcCL_ESM11148 [Trypanosoma cruzi]|nr:hypothetical protein TcCL_ESM11148 [Trypanosoma cruzi]